MSFYGLVDQDDIAAVYEHFSAVKALYDKGGQQTFFGDDMAAFGRTMSFAADADFVAAFEANACDTPRPDQSLAASHLLLGGAHGPGRARRLHRMWRL